MTFVNRDYARTEHDDYELNVAPHLKTGPLNQTNYMASTPIYHDDKIIGWQIKPMYE